jgi:diguanylate cyclase (GGDEF)-like protein
VFANAAACGLLGCEPEQLKRRGLGSRVAPAHAERLQRVVDRVTSTVGREACTVHLDGPAGRLVECTFASEGDEAAVTVVVVTIEDVTERRAAERDLEQRANHDDLTGLHNRAAVLDQLRDLLAEGRDVVVAYVDLDGFKAVNDRDGHAGGDRLLAEVAGALRGGAGPGRDVARMGGDEFVVVAVDAEPDDEAALAAGLRRLVADLPAARAAGVTASVGTARARPDDTPRDLLHRADVAMYRDKRH